MHEIRLHIERLTPALPLISVNISTTDVSEEDVIVRMLLEIIDLSAYYGGFTITVDEEIIPKTDTKYPLATACYIKFESYEGVYKFLEDLNPKK